MAHCKECGRSLTKDEIALHKKIYNRDAEDFSASTAAAGTWMYPLICFARRS